MQISDELKDLVQSDLNENEVILWAGRPTGVKLLDMPYGTSVIIRWIIGLVFVVFALWYRLIFLPSSENMSTNGNFIMLICLIIAAIIAILPLIDIQKLKNKCSYYVTNQRALTLIKGSSGKRVLKEKSFNDISEITSDIISGNRGNIYIGEKLKNSFSKARGSVLSPVSKPEEDEKDRPHIFHSIEAPAEVLSFFPALNSDT